jgi:hypothetical protein
MTSPSRAIEMKKPWFESNKGAPPMSKKLNANRIIVNAAAPVVTITITIDNRYEPPELKMQNSHLMPASVVASHLTTCVAQVLGMIIAAEADALSGKKPDTPPANPS